MENSGQETENIRIINASQQEFYEEHERDSAEWQFNAYTALLSEMKTLGNGIKILDIGGASGIFALKLREMFPDKSCEIVVLDSTEYDTWTKNADKITFVKASAGSLTKQFAPDTFDLVFANLVFHHFIRDTYKKTRDEQSNIMKQIATVLKPSGRLCVNDHFYNGALFDSSSSRIIYTITSSQNPAVVAFSKISGAKSSGVGVCFLSREIWLNLFAKAGFEIESLQEGGKWKIFPLKRICLLLKSIIGYNTIVAKKKE